MTPRLAVRDIALFERQVRFAKPFRFGAVTVDTAPQAYVRVEIEVEGRGTSIGASAEMMMPKWFDKRPELSPAATVDELRRSLAGARDLYLSGDGFDTAFGLHASRVGVQLARCAKESIPPLAAAFGPAEIDKAVLDALLRALGVDFFTAMAGNAAGIDARLTPDLVPSGIDGFLASRAPGASVAIRHTVGLDDELHGAGGVAAIAAGRCTRFFKLKLGGRPQADAERLAAIGREIDTVGGDIQVTLDANEQYADLAALADLMGHLDSDKALAPIARRLLYLEQPMPRDITAQTPLGALARRNVIIDEADDSYGAFAAAKVLGYRGVSSKSCKGLYKSILNAVRAARWSAEGPAYFVSGEDLTCQAGLGVQQDLALGALLGLTHAERNGHHYVAGFGDAPAAEAKAFMAAHPDLYVDRGEGVRLAAAAGALSTASLRKPGFAGGAHPDWASLSPLHEPSHDKNLQEH
ncbi:hypothetical protein JQ557_32160 [Bradyrhizobium sp. U87765 SZCCT0131]|uniref:hypothetical protein n=1 Tax=unclassified Bradyrhizobium TaxID=2631580 RepID=UPI001BA4650D|nr:MULTISPECIES: hypothetical protein [unclassified Bradyrhizobium]MBR1222693.1 hypothetical protein [Bradyrhizobium sp. U87765 SZCCT0131]MBR1265226.1 hypothetical protein [Bradyrhizobium sp. U87765 SZCCT0134]MBR1302995.1 hypothetical protein [Bradyrhizobium sp. U87765 SZCCT0110]MBR1323693.1 hypothetical protein [Bradyrhizobium sp. U87765 SZCCT0109]MBR1346924.1 hypothetical protein [Bradyrhizobium sp. U87765 SZCCT0048]